MEQQKASLSAHKRETHREEIKTTLETISKFGVITEAKASSILLVEVDMQDLSILPKTKGKFVTTHNILTDDKDNPTSFTLKNRVSGFRSTPITVTCALSEYIDLCVEFGVAIREDLRELDTKRGHKDKPKISSLRVPSTPLGRA